MRTRLAALLSAVALIFTGVHCASATATCTPLTIPNPLTVNYTAPAGSYCPGPQVNVQGTVTADLTQATITGTGTGYLFKPAGGANLTVKLGSVSSMAGIVLGLVGSGNRANVDIEGGTLTGVISGVLYKTNDGGRLDATMNGVTGTGMGAGIRTYGSVTLTNDNLTGGGNPSSGEPSGGHALDLNTTGTPVPDQTLTAVGNTITGFTSSGFQGDGLVGEETVWSAYIAGNHISNMSDADVDLKVRLATVQGNTFDGTAGQRQVDAHTGHLYSIGNTYVVPAGAYGVQSSSGSGGVDAQHPTVQGLTSDGDSFDLTAGGLIARALVACTGSTGFTTPRAGVIELRQYAQIGGGSNPWVAPHSVCAVDGLDYFPSVIVN